MNIQQQYVRLSVSLSLVVDVVPDDDVVHTGGHGSADREDKSSIKRLSQQCTDFAALGTVRQEGHTHRATKPPTGIRMFPLHHKTRQKR